MWLKANRANLIRAFGKDKAKAILSEIAACESDNNYNWCHWSHKIDFYMGRIDKILNTCGVESLYPEFPNVFYCNGGDTYDVTVCYDHDKGFIVGDWGSYVEARS